MPSLYHSLGLGADGLFASRQGVDTAGHNIANAQVEGYSRQQVNLKQRDPLDRNGNLIGNGVYVGTISRAHDKFIEGQLNTAHQNGGRAEARAEAMATLEKVYSPDLHANVSDEMTSFFNSLQDLANMPEDFTVRTSVVESGKNLASAFRRTDRDLQAGRAGMDEQVAHTAIQLNDNLAQIAHLNTKIQSLEAGRGQEANDLRDDRDQLLREVSATIDINYYEDQNGMVLVRGPSELTLVDAGRSSQVAVTANGNNSGLNDILVTDWEGNRSVNITNRIEGGRLSALIEVRDQVVPDLIEKNDAMAYALTERFNEIHRRGYGLNTFAEMKGRNFFQGTDGPSGAAAAFGLEDMIVNSTDAIAGASSPLAPGDNVNINQILKIKEEGLLEGDSVTLGDYYANYVGAFGLDVVRSDHHKEATDVMLADLTERRESVAGVSLDEEAMHLMKWQANFTASSKVIAAVDEMLQTVLSLKR